MQKNANLSKYFSAEQMAFAVALADLDDQRTQAAIAESLGVHPTTLCRWKKEVGFSELVWNLTNGNLEAEIGRVSGTLLRNALNGDIRSVRLYFEILGKIGQQKTSTVCTRNHVASADDMAHALMDELTERELKAWVRSTRQRLGMTQVEIDIDFASDEVAILDSAQLRIA